MAYDPISAGEVDADSPADATLWGKVKSNFDFLKALFDGSTGHTHTGAADDAPPVITQMKVGSFTRDMTTASGTQAVTGVGFTPTAIIFFGAETADVEATWGIDDGTTAKDVNKEATNFQNDGSFSITIDEGSSNTYQGKINSFDADGFTITWTKGGAPSGTLTANYLAIK